MTALFDDPILGMWLLLLTGFFLLGFYALGVWIEVRGLRGLAMTTLAICLGLLATLLFWVRAGGDARVSATAITIGIRAIFPVMLLSLFVLVDAWGADMNNHKSLTTRMYEQWKRWSVERKRKRHTRIAVNQ